MIRLAAQATLMALVVTNELLPTRIRVLLVELETDLLGARSVSPSFRKKLIDDERDPVADEGLEPPRIARQPAQDDSTVGPCENGINRNTEYSFCMAE